MVNIFHGNQFFIVHLNICRRHANKQTALPEHKNGCFCLGVTWLLMIFLSYHYGHLGSSVVECLTRDRRAAVPASRASLHCGP